MMNVRMKKFIIVTLILIAGGVGAFFYFRPGPQVTEYKFGTVSRDTIIKTVSESGEAFISDQYPISAPITGIIDELLVKNGDDIKQGQSLFRIKSTATNEDKQTADTALLNAQSNLNLAEQNKVTFQTQLEQAKKDLRNAEEAVVQMNNHLGDNKINPTTGKQYTQLEIDAIYSAREIARLSKTNAEQKFKDADIAIKAAQASVTSAQNNIQKLNDYTVTAPVSGKISNLTLNRGNYVSASSVSSVTAAATAPLLYILPNDRVGIKTSFNEVDAAHILPDQPATVTVDALSNEQFSAAVDRVDTIGIKSQGVVTYTVYLNLKDKEPRIRPGMTTIVEIEVSRNENVLVVPTSAVKPYQNGLALMQQSEDGSITYLPVKTGITDGVKTEILSGVTEGTRIITEIIEPESNGGGLIARPEIN